MSPATSPEDAAGKPAKKPEQGSVPGRNPHPAAPSPQRTGAPAVSKFLAVGAVPWRDFDEAPGVRFKVLKTHRPGNGATLLLEFAPRSQYPAHRHPGGEEYYVLAGELIDGPQRYGAGTYAYHPPGSVHAPRSEVGATVLIFVPHGIELV